MSEREEQLERELDTESEFDFSTDIGSVQPKEEPERTQQDGKSRSGRVRSRLGSLVDGKAVGAASLLSILGIFLVGLIPLVPAVVTSVLGIFFGVFLYGALASESKYGASGLAGVLVGAGSVLWSYFPLSVFGASTTLLGIGVVGGLVAGVVGHYFGRDLRDGLTRDIEPKQ